MSAEQPGYRGALPPRGERMARVWVLIVILGFAFMFVLAALNVPSALFPEPTPTVFPSALPSASPFASEGASPAESGSPAESVSPSPSVSPATSESPAPTP
ncbi:MAG: hypothetical protein WEE67_00205 [Chloroflexota bacterium]